ncbi:Progestin and adipoQ receptor member 4, partial [Halocaridina rubra]
ASHARNPWERRFCFTLPFLMRAGSAFLRVSPSGGGHPKAFTHIILQVISEQIHADLLAVLGGFIGALRIPEKWVPGRLDLLANSHHIMHVVVVYAVYHLHQGAVLDMVWLSGNTTCQFDTSATTSTTPTASF